MYGGVWNLLDHHLSWSSLNWETLLHHFGGPFILPPSFFLSPFLPMGSLWSLVCLFGIYDGCSGCPRSSMSHIILLSGHIFKIINHVCENQLHKRKHFNKHRRNNLSKTGRFVYQKFSADSRIDWQSNRPSPFFIVFNTQITVTFGKGCTHLTLQ